MLDDVERTARGGECACTWTPERPNRTDDQCSGAAQELKRIGEGQVAGHRVIRYRDVDEKGGSVEIAMAPGLGCEVMEKIRTWLGTMGIPAARWHYRVTSYTAGEPDARLFRIPECYSVNRGY